MVTHMKTTIDIADDLLEKAKRRARREKKTLREVVEEALRRRLDEKQPTRTFRLKRHAFHGRGVQPGIVEGDWEKIRDLIYRAG
jgi:Arc/MetJ family transcription regulator